MNFGQVLEQVLDEHGVTQQNAAKAAHISGSMVNKIVRGTRRAPEDVMIRTAATFDSPELCIAAANEVTGGSWVPWLNNVDLHHSTVAWKVREEVMEAYEATGAAPITKRREQMNDEELRQIKVAIMESIEAITALTHQVAVLCKDYGFSWFGMWREHRQFLKAKSYLK